MTIAKKTSEEICAEQGVPATLAAPALMTYRSIGIGVFGAVMRFVGMPLEKIALYMNSAQVQGKGQFRQAIRLTFQQGALAPYRVVGTSSMVAWFAQYSVMGVAFQFFDQALSQVLGVKPVYYGSELMTPPPSKEELARTKPTVDEQMRTVVARLMSPVLAACLESLVSNRAEVQRFFGPQRYAELIQTSKPSLFTRSFGHAFAPNAMRNIIMCQTSFLLTPVTYKLYFPQEQKSVSTLFWYGLGVNIFVGNVVGITQQALWGRSLDYLNQHGTIRYSHVVRQGLASEGMAAFFTVPKWCSRVLMNAPAQGTLPWFYNEVLPLGEEAFMSVVGSGVRLWEESGETLFRPFSSPIMASNFASKTQAQRVPHLISTSPTETEASQASTAGMAASSSPSS